MPTIKDSILTELRVQRRIAIPFAATNLAWFAKTAVTTAFLGRLGELELAGGTLGFTIANVTGFSVLTGLTGSMESICGQAHGAGNRQLLHRTLLMTTLLLLAVSIPIAVIWLHVDKILLHFGQQPDIADVAQRYILYLLPDLVVTSFLAPLKAYLSAQGVTIPTLLSSAVALAFHVPLNVALVRVKGLAGVSIAIWVSDLLVAILLAMYVGVAEQGPKGEVEGRGGVDWWGSQWAVGDWLALLRLAAPCCLTACLEWWCYEILVLLAGRLRDTRRTVAVIAVVLNFDYLLFSVMLSLATCASTRVSNELGAGRAVTARLSAFVSLGMSAIVGVMGAAAMVAARGRWGRLFSRDRETVDGVRRMMLVMAAIEVVNFPLAVCGGVVRGTARPWLGMYASLGGFYLVALPVAVVLAFRVGLGLGGLLLGFLVGAVASVSLLVAFVVCIDWVEEAKKAEMLAGTVTREDGEGCSPQAS